MRPFFIVGCGRSGTSLLRGLLNRHPDVAIPLEGLFILDYLRASQRIPLTKLKGMVIREPELREWGIRPDVSQLGGTQSIAEVIARLHELYAEALGKPNWGHKTPRLIRNLPLLQEHFPGAKVIHLVRDPRAVARSLIRSDVHRSTALHAAQRWVRDVGAGLAFEVEHADSVLRLHYEDMVQDPAKTMSRVVEFLGLHGGQGLLQSPAGSDEYSPFYENIHQSLAHEISSAHIDKWRDELSTRQIEIVDWFASELMRTLGYPASAQPRRPTRLEIRRMQLRRAWGAMLQLARYLRFRPAYLPMLIWRKQRLGFLAGFLSELNF